MGEGLLLGLSWLDRSVSTVLSERKVVKVSSILRCLSNHVEVNFSYKCLVLILFLSGSMRLLVFLILFGYICGYDFFYGEDSFFSFLCSSLFCKRRMFIYLRICLLSF
jgi:hypothetical protein